jgi:hypothetical protein
VTQIIKKQKPDGAWGGNMLGIAPDKALGVRDTGTVAQYRRLLELGIPVDHRSLQLANRLMYRVLSRDPDPKLYFEFQKNAKGDLDYAAWARDLEQEGVTAALARAGHVEDPRLRGATHRMASQVSQFLRSDLSADPFTKRGGRVVLHHDAHPPTTFTVEALAFMPSLQRERAGFLERLINYVTQPAPAQTYSISAGSQMVKPVFHLLGDPIEFESGGRPKDIPFALHWIETLTRLGMLEASPTAQKALAAILKDCDELGVWNPKNLRSLPKSPSGLADFAFPLEALDKKTPESRKADITFRLVLIAKYAGWNLEYT